MARSFTIMTTSGPRRVSGERVARHFLVHREGSDDGAGWRLSHLPTGRLLAETDSPEQARQLAERLAASGDWSADNPDYYRAHPELASALEQALRELAAGGGA